MNTPISYLFELSRKYKFLVFLQGCHNLYKWATWHQMVYLYYSRPYIQLLSSYILSQSWVHSSYDHNQRCTIKIWIFCSNALCFWHITKFIFSVMFTYKACYFITFYINNPDPNDRFHLIWVCIRFRVIVYTKYIGKFENIFRLLINLLNLSVNYFKASWKISIYYLAFRKHDQAEFDFRN